MNPGVPDPAARPRLLATAAGTHRHAFGPVEWGLLAVPAVVWGCSFLFIAVALDAFEPGVVTAGRILFGAAALAVVPGSRRPVPRAEWPRLALLSVTWMAVPFLCFSLAEQWIDSSLAGMVNGSMPLATALVATILLRRVPGPRQLAGLALGFGGVVLVLLPALGDGASGSLAGILLVLLAVACYGVGANVAVPLQQAYGALPVLLRVQAGALALSAPYALAGVPGSSFAWGPFAALVALGALGTGVAFVALTTLIGRAGATRAAVAVYFVPVVAIAVGVAFRDERVALLSLAGVAFVLAGAGLTSRAER